MPHSEKPRAFTLTNERILGRLITIVGVSQAHTPKEEIKDESFTMVRALWDTGANCSVLTKSVIERMGLKPISKAVVCHAQGTSEVNVYKVDLALPNKTLIPDVRIFEGDLNDCEVLIGMDIIGLGDFALTHKGGKTVFSFQIPSTHEYDFVKQIRNGVGQGKKKRK